ncbi:3'-5' exonuclease domain-containing protein 2 [Odoribacter sp. OttesenSCG-928-A06]|nr:3'-5' exonuclease domain-containing protein 2 [Odoribacter sp. OttesenSCG-928-A06]
MFSGWIKKIRKTKKEVEKTEPTPLIASEEIQELPLCAYEGDIVVIDTPDGVEEAVNQLAGFKLLGFDTETKPAFKKGEYHDVSLLQLASDKGVYLFRLHKCGFPPALRKILSNPEIQKLGVGIRDDIKALNRLGNFAPESFIDLQSFVEEYGIQEKSFSKLMARIFGVKISKRQRVSNWENPILTEAQLRYAATDAWGALRMYQELNENWSKE